MKKRIFVFLIISIMAFSMASQVFAGDALSVSAKSAVIIEADSREVIFEKDAHCPMPMASTTKIMTAIVVLEKTELSHKFTVDPSVVGTEGTSAYLEKGDTLTIESALYALLLQSANDSANALAIETAGSIDGFVALMNEKAKDLGLENTSFKNPSGLPAEGHFSTAYDLARLGAYCLENEIFSEIVSTVSKTVEIGGKERTFVNHNKLLTKYDSAIGIKTGFTKESGRCLIGAAEKDGVRLITVTLSASCDWKDHGAMFEYGFSRLQSYTLCEKDDFLICAPFADTERILLTPDKTYTATLEQGAKISVVVERTSLLGDTQNSKAPLAYAVFYNSSKKIAKIPLYGYNYGKD